jgi:hypothetical protein
VVTSTAVVQEQGSSRPGRLQQPDRPDSDIEPPHDISSIQIRKQLWPLWRPLAVASLCLGEQRGR